MVIMTQDSIDIITNIEEVSIIRVGEELIDAPGGGGGANPLPGVDATVKVDSRLVTASALAELQDLK